MVISIFLLAISILLIVYLIWILYKYIIAFLYCNSLSEEDAKWLYKKAVGKNDGRYDL